MRNPNSFGGISKLSGKRRNPYMVRVTTGFNECGKQQYRILGYYPTRREAMQTLVEYNYNPNQYDASKLTFAEVYEKFSKFKWLRENKVVPTEYKSAFKRYTKLHNSVFSDLRLLDLQDVMDECELGFSAKRSTKSLLNMMYEFAISNGFVQENYSKALALPPNIKSEKHTPFTHKEIKTLWENKDNVIAQLWLILCYTGARPTELLKIRTENIHLDESYMVGGIKTDFSKNRPIPIADCIKPFIASYYNENNEFLLNAVFKKDYLYREKLVETAKELNIEHLPHDGRHTCATELHKLKPTVSELTIQKILGHTPVTITDRVYTHVDIEEMVNAVNLLPTFN